MLGLSVGVGEAAGGEELGKGLNDELGVDDESVGTVIRGVAVGEDEGNIPASQ